MKSQIVKRDGYNFLIDSIGELLEIAHRKVYNQINNILINTYWNIGRQIVEYEQKGNTKAEYGTYLLDMLSKDLMTKYGKGFSRSNLIYIRLLFLKYPKSETLSHQLTWSHYFELLKIDDELERGFYEKQCIFENWSVRELKRQKESALFHRIAISKEPQEILMLSRKGQITEKHKDIFRDPYILEFLNIPENYNYSEKELEQRIIDNLTMFMLELGKGFSFVSRQYRINLDNEHYYVDLVFYHRILKCFVLIDLKIGKATHQDIGQMNMYLNYFKKEESREDDNPPIGIILAAEKNEVLIEYALGGISNNLFVSKYQLYLPNKELLAEKIKDLINK